MIEKLRNILSGGKTYLVCIGAIVTALVAFANGGIDVIGLGQAIFAAVVAMTMRAGIAKSGPTE